MTEGETVDITITKSAAKFLLRAGEHGLPQDNPSYTEIIDYLRRRGRDGARGGSSPRSYGFDSMDIFDEDGDLLK